MINSISSVQKRDITGFSYQLSNIEERLVEIIQLLHQINENQPLKSQEVKND